ncbi:hypothetical protein PaG_02079 [Moesziomyces aphidis]|uniref:RING-type domain-containing protein n=1 Tax=Moesziomyces aphidis TaxID=84754 RepID=W3VSK2_MOEAP|nr:hypothetical protein PaG_02079 [Moesziomyces aphidis]
MPSSTTSTPSSTQLEDPLPRPTVVGGSRSSSRSSSRNQSVYSSAPHSRSNSPTPPQDGAGRSRSRTSSRRSSLAPGPSRTRSSTSPQRHPMRAVDPNIVVEISSDSSDDDDVVPVGPAFVPRPSSTSRANDFVEVSSIRRARAAPPTERSNLFSPPAMNGPPAEPFLFSHVRSGRNVGLSVDPSTGDFLTRPMPIVRSDRSISQSDDDSSFSILSARTAARPAPAPPPARSEHPITDMRLRSSNLAMPTKSPPRSKPPPIEHPLLSKYTCPICFDAPTNLSVTPCGHFFCGGCLFQALKTQAVQRGAMEEEQSFLRFGGLFAPDAFPIDREAFSEAVSPSGRSAGAVGATSAGRGRGGRGGGASGGRGRSKPDPLAGQCPVCRAKIKGGFNGREKSGILGLRLTIGKPVDDPREESGKMKGDSAPGEDASADSSETEDEAAWLSSRKVKDASKDSKSAEQQQPQHGAGSGPALGRGKRRPQRSSTNALTSSDRSTATAEGSRGRSSKRQRHASSSSATATE